MPFEPRPAHSWHVLFAPLPPDAVPRRQPVAPLEVLATPEGAAVAGWENIIVDLSAGAAGMRVAMVLLDAAGQPLSAGDEVLYRSETAPGVVEYYQESVGGRFEPDGTFRGTRWRTITVERGDDEDDRETNATPSPPTDADVAGIKAVVADLLRRT